VADAPKRRRATRATPGRARARARADWRERFLAEFSRCGVVKHAAAAAGVHRATVYRTIEGDEAFAAAFREAEEEAVDELDLEAFRRGAQGVDEPVFWQGQQVGAVRRYSDQLLIFLLRARKPEKYSERYRLEHGGHVEHRGITLTQLGELARRHREAKEEADKS
jgi:hypothetical protein